MSEPQQQIVPHIIIPCAGEGKRFKEQGYTEPKPLIPVGGRLMLDWVLDVVPKDWMRQVIPVVKGDHSILYDTFVSTEEFRQSRFDVAEPCLLVGPTQGAACSVLAAAVGLPPDEPVIVLNSDQYIKCNLQAIHDKAMAEGWDAFILTFPGTGPAWSYVVTDGTDLVVQVVEKKQVSDKATCGLYWFRRASDLIYAISSMIYKDDRVNNEFYLAPAVNHLPLHRRNVRAVPVKVFHGLGTPEQVKLFEQHIVTRTQPELAGVGAR